VNARAILGGLALVLGLGVLALVAGDRGSSDGAISAPAADPDRGSAVRVAPPRGALAADPGGSRRPEEAPPPPPVESTEALLTPAERWAIEYRDHDAAALTKARDVLALEMSRQEAKIIRSRLDSGRYEGYLLDDGRGIPDLNALRDQCLAARERYFEQTAFRNDGAAEYQFLVIPRAEYPAFYEVADERAFLDDKLIALGAWQPLGSAPGGSPNAW
jgi:hypothetical protein